MTHCRARLQVSSRAGRVERGNGSGIASSYVSNNVQGIYNRPKTVLNLDTLPDTLKRPLLGTGALDLDTSLPSLRAPTAPWPLPVWRDG